MARAIDPDAFRLAAEWVDHYDEEDAERSADLKRVAHFLREEADRRELSAGVREMMRVGKNVPRAFAIRAVKAAMGKLP